LSPADLLHLSRLNYSFRKLLLSQSSRALWKTSRSNVSELPPCPEWLSEPRFANLCFEAHCDSCLKDIGYSATMWQFNVRCCPHCQESMCVLHTEQSPNN
ncbi:hypothetical protein C8Q76DRAFT_622767, partial [Earliella scabrosa]